MIPYSKQQIIQSDIDAVCEALKGDFLTGGKNVDAFEDALCEYLGVKNVVVMNSATSALHVAYAIFGIKQQDEVITTPITFAATANAALMCGADVRFCDVKDDGNIDESLIQNLINSQTKVISVVDFGGNPVEIQNIINTAKKHGIKVLDDASHALGSEIDGVKVGNHADISVFSFHAIKPITTFEGGAIVTNSDEYANLARLYRSHGISKTELWDSDMSLLGYNYRLSDVACALGVNQLKRLDDMIAVREEIAQFYDESFKDNEFFKTIKIPSNKKSSRHLYPIILDEKLARFKKEIFIKLHELGIGVQVHYKPTYEFSFYKQKYKDISLKNAENFYSRELSLPCHQGMSLSDARFVSEKLLGVLKEILK
ncbi:UDP-4-amino-4,6-dideoxy-N-acetyl-beta-L-altrosamine transaminase [Campylobacter pinnipediorum subsp. caledonicus]|uniref:UDP-4-amino-4, 6-dideoxy-N-acetyl-beta-L-altrosamine transaminase n=1 Tax=Campylobacter pinnipediorum TaxID=1965231 RepID=UPI0009949C48|nr:UDP-4-amino-4,6-dideoxy-N-acetyl-beta-L-altrosamine transaminase [Campylobacter pinnipediorum]OPA71946.1 UDP-4-amino-4,6-dideoxy-N-acetyl-beta-L-altrosamine transaminase [Campylobacter pinnipediorum subsp. caledonicus]